jgi:hypothetical protein
MTANRFRIIILLFAMCTAWRSAAAERMIAPPPVAAAMRDLSKGGSAELVEQRSENGEQLFDVEVTSGAVTRVFTLDHEGVPIATEVFEQELPAAVQRALKGELGTDGKLEGLMRALEDGKPVFEAEIVRSGKTATCTFAANGVVITREVPTAEVPPAVRASLQRHLYGGRAGRQYYKSSEGSLTYFVGSVEFAERAVWLTFLPGGRMVMREEKIPLSDAPAPVQAAISTRLGNSEHVRITQCQDDGETYFEVLALVNAKVQNFFVLPSGKISPTPPE